jgi:hypothetical protein
VYVSNRNANKLFDMPNWKKVIVSGSNAALNSLTVSNGITGSLFGTSSFAVTSSFITASNVFGPYGSNSVISASFAQTSSYAKNINISGSINNVDYIDFNTSATVTQPVAGRLSWNDSDGTLDLGLKGGNVTLQIGQEEVARVVNKSGVNLTEAGYQAVKILGAQGQRLSVTLAQGNNDANSQDTLGLVTEDISNNQEGFVTSNGLVRGINTTGALQSETWAEGDQLYLSPTTAGRITNIPPVAPQHTVRIGYVVSSNANNGSIFVKIDNGYELGELHDVVDNTTTSSYGDLLIKSGSVWTNSKQLTGSYGLTGSLTAINGGFTGSLFGTSSYATNALTASYVLNATSSSYASNADLLDGLNSTVFATTGSNIFTGAQIISSSLTVFTGSAIEFQVLNTGVKIGNLITDTHTVTGSLNISGSVTATSLTVSGSTGTLFSSNVDTLILTGSMIVTGSSVITGSLSVGISTIIANRIAVSSAGANAVFTQVTGSFTGAKYLYTVTSASNARTGEVMAVWNGTTVQYTDNSTLDIGSTTAVTASVSIVTSQAQFNMQTTNAGWTIKSQVTYL